jgi:hypothetical protein
MQSPRDSDRILTEPRLLSQPDSLIWRHVSTLYAASAALGPDDKVSPPMELPLMGSMIVKTTRIREWPATSLAAVRDERNERADTLAF